MGEEQEQEGRAQEIGIKRPGMFGSGQGGCVDWRVCERRGWESRALGSVFFLSVLSLHFVFSDVF